MGEFFNGWRRKTGCVTLVMACLLTDGWILSASRTDIANFRLLGKQHIVSSEEQSIQWGAEVPHTILWDVWYVPYWSVVLPLTLLAAWLLLSKPRKSFAKPTEISE